MSELEKFQDEIEKSVEKLKNSVVRINTRKMARTFGYGVAPVMGSASGIVVDSRGYIVTNNHVLEGSEMVEVILPTGESRTGNVLGSDSSTDIAIVKIEGGELPVAELADSEKVKPGHMVLAIGNSLGLPGGPTISMGIVGAVGRPLPWADFIFEGLIQTDAAINPGNSGGPLANLRGEVIGINTAIIPSAQGVGFAIPVNTVKSIMADIIKYGRVVRPWLGISGMNLTKGLARSYNIRAESGVLVARISYDSPADYAGLEPGDVIISAGEKEIAGMKDLLEFLSRERVGSNADITFIRRGRKYRTSIKLEESPTVEKVVRPVIE